MGFIGQAGARLAQREAARRTAAIPVVGPLRRSKFADAAADAIQPLFETKFNRLVANKVTRNAQPPRLSTRALSTTGVNYLPPAGFRRMGRPTTYTPFMNK